MAVDYYQILSVPRQASGDDIRTAYLRLAQESHPDRNGETPAGGENRFKEIQRAYEVLSDPAQRAAYDRSPTAFRRAAKNPVQYRGTTFKQSPRKPHAARPVDGYARRDVPYSWVRRNTSSKGVWLRTSIWLLIIALCAWGCSRVLTLVIAATLADSETLPNVRPNARPDVTQEQIVELVVQDDVPPPASNENHVLAPAPDVFRDVESDGQDDAQQALTGDRPWESGMGDDWGVPDYRPNPQFAIDEFVYPGQTGYDAALIEELDLTELEASYAEPTTALPIQSNSTGEIPLPRHPKRDSKFDANRFDIRGQYPPAVPSFSAPSLSAPSLSGPPLHTPNWPANWFDRESPYHPGSQPQGDLEPTVSNQRTYGYGDPSLKTSRPGHSGRPLASQVLRSPYGDQPRPGPYGGPLRPYGNPRDRFSPRTSIGTSRWGTGGGDTRSDQSGPVPSNPFSPTYPRAGASLYSPSSPYSSESGLYGRDR